MEEKKFQIMNIKAVLSNKKEEVDLYVLVDKELIKKIPRDKIKSELEMDLKNVHLEKPVHIKKTIISYGFVEPESLKDFDYGNTLVEAHLPYCLHVPTNYDFEVNFFEKGYSANVIFQKFWSEKARDSDNVDIFSEDKPTYFQRSTIYTPVFPIKTDLGWEQQFTGKNIEKEKDANGTFRYTRVFIQFDTEITKNVLEDEKRMETILKDISNKSLDIINRVLDVYRYITKEEYVERLGSLSINNIYFKNHNKGFYVTSMGYGIKSAMMNRSRKEIYKIEEMLSKNDKPPLFELLFLNAQSSLNKKSFAFVVLETFQALEIFLENYLISKFLEKGLTEVEINKKMEEKWRTKERLKDLLKEAVGHSLLENQELWGNWCTIYDKVRKEVIHKSKEINLKDAEKTLKTNREVVTWIKNLK